MRTSVHDFTSKRKAISLDAASTFAFAAHLDARQLRIAEAVGRVVVDHAHGLHEGIADGGAAEAKPCLLEGLAHGLGFGRFSGKVADGFESVLARRAAHKP